MARSAPAPHARPASPSAVPHFALFGELDAPSQQPLLHLESIHSRSRRHAWRISDHAHNTLFQVLVLRRGWVQLRADGRELRASAPVALTVPAGVVHGFRFDPRVDGDVISISDGLLSGVGDPQWGELADALRAAPQVLALTGEAMRRLRPLLAQIRSECAQPAPGQGWMLGWLARAVLLWVLRQREASRDPALPVTPSTARWMRFRRLVDAHYLERRSIGFYAAALGMTERALRRMAQEQGAGSPGRVLDERLALEARRRLCYSHDAVARIAYDLGFEDPAYFSRFMRRVGGVSPTALRRGAASPERAPGSR